MWATSVISHNNLSRAANIMEFTMAMLNWNDYRNLVLDRVGEIGKLGPDTVKGYAMLGGTGAKTGLLDAKTRELIGDQPTLRWLYRGSHRGSEKARRHQGRNGRSAGRRNQRQCRGRIGLFSPNA
jgi:hypothetical protein